MVPHQTIFCGLRTAKKEKKSEFCQWVSASLSQSEPYCKTASVLVPSPFITVGWPWEEELDKPSSFLVKRGWLVKHQHQEGKGECYPLLKVSVCI